MARILPESSAKKNWCVIVSGCEVQVLIDNIFFQVAGVRFRAFSENTLQRLQNNHRLITVRALKWREALHAWNHGTMTALGSRQPVGGRRGDSYVPYAIHSGQTVDDIKALFRHAEVRHPSKNYRFFKTVTYVLQDADTLIAVGGTIYPQMHHDISEITAKARTNRFGALGLSVFYCDGYISLPHVDDDAGLIDVASDAGDTDACDNDDLGGLYPCAQLEKRNCGPDDYNFALLKYGIAIRTEENCVW